MGRGIGRLRHPPSDLSCWLLQVIASSPLLLDQISNSGPFRQFLYSIKIPAERRS
ncbi:hypothetical protein M752DRAFT_277480 [Aspergillus phoenicis ATCC 13157]|uniref:Uncharacterized protein n=1 Tax=Aspergillus phoenicis ATCC 13157 TaxID=1353007 RepID=A0A370PF51_ASPPH|nr:hypothetical protein M752DRAFT_277480 [Aspergillus phoenicis ATCC 13157]